MASPQKENGFTPIANELFEETYRLKINTDAFRLVLFIMRKTYGWKKKRDKIALSQFSEELQMKRQHVCRNLNKLVDMKIILRIQDDNGNEYEINKNYEEWEVVPKQGRPQTGNEVVPKQVTHPVPKQGHTKETIQKKIQNDASVALPKTYNNFRDRARVKLGKEPMGSRPMTQSQKRTFNELLALEPDISIYKELAGSVGFSYLELPEDANSKVRRQMLSARSRFQDEVQDFYRWIFTTSNPWPKKVNYHPESCITSIMFDAYKNRNSENKDNSILKSWGV